MKIFLTSFNLHPKLIHYPLLYMAMIFCIAYILLYMFALLPVNSLERKQAQRLLTGRIMNFKSFLRERSITVTWIDSELSFQEKLYPQVFGKTISNNCLPSQMAEATIPAWANQSPGAKN